VVDAVAPAVVTIRIEKQAEAEAVPDAFREFFGRDFRQQAPQRERGLGSGVIIRPDGYILTNNHVAGDADRIHVDMSDGRTFTAKLIGKDEASDLAVIRIDAANLPTLPFGDSDHVKVGDVVLAFGNPLGVGQTVTMGIVSAKGRTTGVGNGGGYEDFLQTDAPINQGNSGGALVNMHGELVGINAQILSPSGGNIGIGFAIPSGMAHAVAEQLINGGVVHRSKLGATIQDVTPDLAESLGMHETRGALVSGVEPGSPADHAGLKQGDVITALDGRTVTDANTLRNQVASSAPGTTVSMTVMRNGKPQTLSARLAERESAVAAKGRPVRGGDRGESHFGMQLIPVTPSVAQELNLPKGASGVAVTGVDPSGVAASAGIREGDVIRSVNGHETKDVDTLRSALAEHTDRPALLLVDREGASIFVALPQPRG
jgi:Do/DeqQ family serine protease